MTAALPQDLIAAQHYCELGKWGKVRDSLGRLTSEDAAEFSQPILLIESRVAEREGRIGDAFRLLQDALQINPRDRDARAHYIRHVVDHGADHDLASGLIREWRSDFPNDHWGLYIAGFFYMRIGKYTEALQQALNGLQCHPGNIDCLSLRYDILAEMPDADLTDLEQALEELVAHHPNARESLTRQYQAAGDVSDHRSRLAIAEQLFELDRRSHANVELVYLARLRYLATFVSRQWQATFKWMEGALFRIQYVGPVLFLVLLAMSLPAVFLVCVFEVPLLYVVDLLGKFPRFNPYRMESHTGFRWYMSWLGVGLSSFALLVASVLTIAWLGLIISLAGLAIWLVVDFLRFVS